MQPFFWYNILITIGMLFSIPYFFIGDKQYKKMHLVIFIILVIISIVEISGKYRQLLSQNNTIIYNVGYIMMGLSLKLYFFSLVFEGKNDKRMATYLLTAFILWVTVNFLFFQPFQVFHHYSLAFGSFIIIGLSLYYFYGIFFKNWYLNKNLLAVPEFWIVSFLMFFYACSFLYFVSFNFFYEQVDIALYIQLNFLIKILGSIMYLILGLAFYAPYIFRKEVKGI
jgi:hypothetical protein